MAAVNFPCGECGECDGSHPPPTRESHAKDVFDRCWARYRKLCDRHAANAGRISIVRADRVLDGRTPNTRPVWQDWNRGMFEEIAFIVDFERIGREALEACPAWEKRLKLFEIYFLQETEYREAQKQLGVAPGTLDYWYQEVKKTCGMRFIERGLAS